MPWCLSKCSIMLYLWRYMTLFMLSWRERTGSWQISDFFCTNLLSKNCTVYSLTAFYPNMRAFRQSCSIWPDIKGHKVKKKSFSPVTIRWHRQLRDVYCIGCCFFFFNPIIGMVLSVYDISKSRHSFWYTSDIFPFWTLSKLRALPIVSS